MIRILIAWAFVAQSMAFGQTFEEHCKNSANLPPAQQAFINSVLNETHADCATVQKKVSQHGQLNLSYEKLTDISLIASIKDIKALELRENQLEDISALAGLETLHKLDLAGNMLSDISALAELNRLTTLNLSENFIADLAPLKGLVALKTLYLHENSITDYSSLRGLAHLAELTVGEYFWGTPQQCRQDDGGFAQQDKQTADSLDQIIAELTSLEKFLAKGINFNSTVNFEKLAKIKFLGIRCASIEKTKALAALPKLESLILSFNRLHSIEPPPQPKVFETLDLEGNFLTDNKILASFRDIRAINLSHNALAGEFVLSSRDSLRRLELAGNALKYVDLQGEFPKLSTLDISRNRIKHVHFANSKDQLSFFIAHHNQLINPTAAMNLSEVYIIDIAHNRVRDFSFIEDIRIEEESEGFAVHVGGNPTTDFSTITNPDLDRFIIRGSGLSKLVHLPNVKGLRVLDIGDNHFLTVEGLSKKYPYLKELAIDGNPLTDGEQLVELRRLRSLDASRTKIRTWEFLAEFANLSSISLRSNRIAELGFLKHVNQVRRLDLSRNSISDLSAFTNPALRELYSLKLHSNLISDATPLSALAELSGFKGLELKDNPLGTTIAKTPENCPTSSKNRGLNRWCKF